VGVYGGKDLRKRYLLSLEWKRVGVMDNDSGDDGTDELRQFSWEEWEKEWWGVGLQMKQEVYSKGKEMHNEMKVDCDLWDLKWRWAVACETWLEGMAFSNFSLQ